MKRRRAHLLDRKDSAPKTAIQHKISAAELACVGLADSSAQRVNSTGARASAAINGVPVNLEILRRGRTTQKQNNQQDDRRKQGARFHNRDLMLFFLPQSGLPA